MKRLLTSLAPFALALAILAVSVGLARLALGPFTMETPDRTSHAAPTSTKPRDPLRVPGDDTLSPGRDGDLVRRGRTLAMRTSEELPALVGADLHCTSCHLDGGTRAYAAPWIGVTSVYPLYRDRAGREISIEDRIDECFERSLNGRAPGKGSDETKALVAYMTWLSRDVPKGGEIVGRGFATFEAPPDVDPVRGKRSFATRCAACHGAEGQGMRGADGAYLYPPVSGNRSFNIGAGMARLNTAAAFVRHNMPLGQGESITPADAYDIAAYFTASARPDFARKCEDWPRGGKPRDARY